MAEECMRRVLALLMKAGCMDLGKQEARGPLRPARKTLSGVGAMGLACSLLRSGSKPVQVRGGRQAMGKSVGGGRGLLLGAQREGCHLMQTHRRSLAVPAGQGKKR
ncbi:hypothetical protein NDU88_008856 [Pleurodeles waltl]|uniref:Uncharacterized protein n=1 Tax=Pleurodeles waltl TaxID=8319 RepID=A0AAV7QPT8_PLEWA|nr:hypothetical protein NDU88_008856 [Pleurodeles waltl]